MTNYYHSGLVYLLTILPRTWPRIWLQSRHNTPLTINHIKCIKCRTPLSNLNWTISLYIFLSSFHISSHITVSLLCPSFADLLNIGSIKTVAYQSKFVLYCKSIFQRSQQRTYFKHKFYLPKRLSLRYK